MATYHGETMVWRYDEQVCLKCEGRRQRDGSHTKTQTYTKPQDARRRRQDKGKPWYATPPPPHPQTSTRFPYRGRQQEAAQGMTSMLQKKTRKRLPRPLYRGNARRRGVLSKTQREKKREETQNTTRKKKKDLRTLFLYRGRKHGGTKGKVRATHRACHAVLLRIYRTSSSAF